MTLNCDCTEKDNQLKADKNIFSEYLLSTTIHGIVTPQIPSNLLYLFKECPLNNILKKYFIAENELLYQVFKNINTKYEEAKTEFNVLVNKGILNNGNIRQNIAAEITEIREALSEANQQFDNFNASSLKLVEKLEMDISETTRGKLNASTLKDIQQSIRQKMTKTLKQILDRWIILQNTIIIAVAEADSSSVIFLEDANTPAE